MAIGSSTPTSNSNTGTATKGTSTKSTSTEKKEKTTTSSSGGYPKTSATNKGYTGRTSPSTTDPGQPNNPGYTGRNSNPEYGGAPTSSPYSTNGSGSKRGGTKHTTTTTVKDEPVMTVDEVYGKEKKTVAGYNTASNTTSSVTSSYLPSVEKQGDYAASSNEKSVVKTDTFGKQDEISVTPEMVTENKGEVGNDSIQSVEGLDFQQKDKESQAVLDSKKSRDEVEAEEKAGTMRDKLRNLNKTENETDTETDFRIGESDAEKAYNEENAKRQRVEDTQKNDAALAEKYASDAKKDQEADRARNAEIIARSKEMEQDASADKARVEAAVEAKDYSTQNKLALELTDKYGIKSKVMDLEVVLPQIVEKCDEKIKLAQDGRKDAEYNEAQLDKEIKDLENDAAVKKAKYDKTVKDNEAWRVEAWKEVENANTEPETTNTETETETITEETVPETTTTETTSVEETKKVILESNASEEVKTEAIEMIDSVRESKNDLLTVVAELPKDIESATPEQIEAYVKTNEKYLNNVKKANNKGVKFANTDFNPDYTKEISKANDFDITFSDGSTMSYADFSATMATKSPQIASAMYDAKAKRYEEEGKNILANIERMKSKMAMDTVGSKFTFADDKVRNQFIQMAETNERATYAAYNNVITDKSGKYSADDIAEAEASMKQAEMLSTAAATLKASTGLLSGSGDSVSDGVYGTTNPNELETYQKIINTIENATKIILGAGVTPGAADAWNNLYYTAGDEVRNSKLFNTVFDFDPDGDGFNVFQEYGNNATVGLVTGLIELGTGVAMAFNPSTAGFSANLIKDSITTFFDNLYGVQGDAKKAAEYTKQVLDYFNEAKDIASKAGNEEVLEEIEEAINTITTRTETGYDTTSDNNVTVNKSFELKQDEVDDVDNWLEGSGSNTTDNEKFNQALTYDEWLKLIEADPTMREYAKSLLKDKSSNEAETDAKKADA